MPRARLPQLQSITEGSFEPNRKNPILLGDDDSLDTHQKVIKIGGVNSPLSLSKNEIRINSDIFIGGNLTNNVISTDQEYLDFVSNAYFRFYPKNIDVGKELYFTVTPDTGSFLLASEGDITLIANGGDMDLNASDSLDIFSSNVYFKHSITNYALLNVQDSGVTSLSTVDSDGTAGHLTLDADGDIIIDAATGNITAEDNGGNYTPSSDYHIATKKYVDDNAGGSNFITDNADDTMAGTLTIDKDSTATSTANVSGLLIDFDHTGICASGQTINNRSFTSVINSNSPTHVGTVNNFGIINSVVSGTSGTQNNYGIYNTIVSGDTKVGIYQNVTDGGTDLQFVSSADTGDYFSIATTAHGATTIATVDDDATAADLTLDIDGDIELNADGGDITFKDDTITLASLSSTAFYSGSPIYLKEKGSAEADVAGQGQVWVKDDAPNCLAFTDDAGTDIVGIGKYHYETKCMGYYASQTASYLPINGYILERTSTSGANEYIGFVAPYDGIISKAMFRSEVAQDGSLSFRVLESADGTETPGTPIYRKDHTIDIADDTSLDIDMTSPSTGSDYSPMTKGRIYAFYLNTPSNSLDTNVTLVFRWDITS